MAAVTDDQKMIISRVINVFETGSTGGDYTRIVVFPDGPGGRHQITYGRSQTTQVSDNLGRLLRLYCEINGEYSDHFTPYLDRAADPNLHEDGAFLDLLRQAGNDPVMQTAQDNFFDRRYFLPAEKWWSDHGMEEALSLLVIYDSWIHSGGIRMFLRNHFRESPSSACGRERVWTARYAEIRHQWLKHCTSPGNPEKQRLLRNSRYRTRCLPEEIDRSNRDLSMLPITANGVDVTL